MPSFHNLPLYPPINECIQRMMAVGSQPEMNALRTLLLLTGSANELDHALLRTSDSDIVLMCKTLDLLAQTDQTPSA